MPKHSPKQIEHHIQVIDAELAAKRDTLPQLESKNAVDRKIRLEFQQRIAELERGISFWESELRKLTGQASTIPRAKTFTQMSAEAEQERQQKLQVQREAQKYKTAVKNDYLKLKSRLDECRGLKQRLQTYIAENWHVMFMITLAGGRSWSNLMLIEATLLKKADHLLQQANRQIAAGQHAHAVALLESAANYLNTAGAEMSKFQASLETGTERICTTIKVTSSVMTPGGTLSSGATVGVSVFKAGVEQGTGLVAQAVDSKRSVSQGELTNAAKDVLIEGGAAAAGEYGKSMLAGPMASLLYKGKPTPAQIEAVGNVIAEYYAANSKQLITAIRDIADGKQPSYSMLAGLIAPVLKSRSGNLPKSTGEALSEGQVAKELEELVKKNK